jgi:hypothetical protein
MMMRTTKQFLDYVIEIGYTDVKDLRKGIDKMLTKFLELNDWVEKNTESDWYEIMKLLK